MIFKVLILTLTIMVVAARPQHGGGKPTETSQEAQVQTTGVYVDGVLYPELPVDGSDCEVGVKYHHYGNLCECKPDQEVSCKRINRVTG